MKIEVPDDFLDAAKELQMPDAEYLKLLKESNNLHRVMTEGLIAELNKEREENNNLRTEIEQMKGDYNGE